MSIESRRPGPTGNLVLDALPPVERARLLERARIRTCRAEEILVTEREPIASVWFPVTAVVSLLTVLRDGTGVETATVGREGILGVVVFLGDDRIRNGRAVIQLGGDVIGVPVEDFRAVLIEDGKLRAWMMDVTRALLFQVSQGVACNAAHTVLQRLARWLLQTTERVGRDDIELTQQFLAEILHARRASVTEAISSLGSTGAVRRSRGRIEVVSRAAVERAACECYAVVRQEYDRIMMTA